jgi:hypothetical protein
MVNFVKILFVKTLLNGVIFEIYNKETQKIQVTIIFN